jgi:MoxR-like ATPase
MLKIVINYPSRDEERDILRENIAKQFPSVEALLKPSDILSAREIVKDVYMDEKIEQYILDIIFATRYPADYKLEKLSQLISYGASPRGSIYLAIAAKAYAFIKRRGYVIPEDIRAICLDVLRHRIGITYEAEAENISSEDIINEILNTVEVP